MATKLILRWDIQPGSESDYFEFMVSEFILSTVVIRVNEAA